MTRHATDPYGPLLRAALHEDAPPCGVCSRPCATAVCPRCRPHVTVRRPAAPELLTDAGREQLRAELTAERFPGRGR